MKLWKLLLIYAVIAVIAYAVIYYMFLMPVAPMTSGGCTPTVYNPC